MALFNFSRGQSPRNPINHMTKALKARFNRENNFGDTMHRAFSAGRRFIHESWGAALRLTLNAAPLAQNANAVLPPHASTVQRR